jgi:hypothetical protein
MSELEDPAPAESMKRKFNAAMAQSGLPKDFIQRTEEKKFLREDGMRAIFAKPARIAEQLISVAFQLSILSKFDRDVNEALEIASAELADAE